CSSADALPMESRSCSNFLPYGAALNDTGRGDRTMATVSLGKSVKTRRIIKKLSGSGISTETILVAGLTRLLTMLGMGEDRGCLGDQFPSRNFPIRNSYSA